jgi:putative DNA primase/helicase
VQRRDRGWLRAYGAGKHPVHRLVPHGLHDASSRRDTVARWWQSAPCANVGIRTGPASGLVVLDVDGRAGRLALRALVASRPRLQARWARTGGGWHAYFAHLGTAVPNSAGRLGEGIDVRGDGGYVVAPPSRHASGRPYRWVGEEEAFAAIIGDPGHLSPMPTWLVELVIARPAAASQRQVSLRAADATAYAAAARAPAARDRPAPVGRVNVKGKTSRRDREKTRRKDRQDPAFL